MNLSRKILAATLCIGLTAPAIAKEFNLANMLYGSGNTATAPTTPNIEVGFSPNGGAEDLVLKTINTAHKSLRVLAYSFTSKPIAQALINASKRGVDVKVVVDKSQKSERYTSASFLANMGIPVRVDSRHAIQHNKTVLADNQTVETGSFNYTSSAAQRNAENAIVLWNNPKLAAIYLKDWENHWNHAEPYQARY